MEIEEYIQEKEEKLKKDSAYTKEEWDKIRIQIKSGYSLNLDYEEIDMYATFCLDYFQREVVKLAYFILEDKKIPKLLLERTYKEKLSYKEMIKALDDLRDHLFLCSLSKRLDKSIEKIEALQDKLYQENKTNDKEPEEKVVAGPKKKIHRLKKSKEDSSEKGHIPVDFKIEELPPEFNLSVYMLKSSLSSSQMEIITYAVKLGVNESIIKQMVDSKLPAENLKQIVKVLVAQMEQKSKVVEEIPDDAFIN